MAILSSLGIDLWGVALYLGNFGVLLFFLHRYLFKPLLKFLDERRAIIERNIEGAEHARREFEAELAKEKQAGAELQRRLEKSVADAKRSAEEQGAALVAAAQRRSEHMVTEAKELIEQAKRGMVREAEAEILDRMQRALTAIVKGKVPATVVEESVEAAWRETAR